METRKSPIKDTSKIIRNPSLHNSGKGLHMIVLVFLIVLLRGFPCFHDFFAWCIPTCIHMNYFCTCILYNRPAKINCPYFFPSFSAGCNISGSVAISIARLCLSVLWHHQMSVQATAALDICCRVVNNLLKLSQKLLMSLLELFATPIEGMC